MSDLQKIIAEAIITPWSPDHGSLHHTVSGIGAFAGLYTGGLMAESAGWLQAGSVADAEHPRHEATDADIITGAALGAVLGATAVYSAVRQYAIRHLGRETYDQIKARA